MSLPADETAQRYAGEVLNAARRAASLTKQLLAFSRKQTTRRTSISLNAVVNETERMLRRVIGEDVELTLSCEPNLKLVRADRGHLEQLLMNLVVNARDAMPKGGNLTIHTGNVELTQADKVRYPYVNPGLYVMLSVSDTGCGMDEQTKSRIFEAFFTTKEPGKGTGLGLSTVYDLVKQNEGYIWVDSQPGLGSRFRVYLPQSEGIAEADPAEDRSSALPVGSETILLVEDETPLRELAATCLRAAGFKVIEVSDGYAALDACVRYQEDLDLLLTDVILPGMSGREVGERVSEVRPGIKILYMSGYTEDMITFQGGLPSDVILLEKPFTIGSLLRRIRQALDRPNLAMLPSDSSRKPAAAVAPQELLDSKSDRR